MDDATTPVMPDPIPLLAHVERGDGDPIVLVHGNPTSSYLWREVLPVVARHGRAIAPDLLGMGDSPGLPASGPGQYRVSQHAAALEHLLATLDVTERVVLVGHDWGGALALDWARRHPDAVRGVAWTEAVVRPRRLADEDAGGQDLFTRLRGPEGEDLVLRDNVFVEQVLPGECRDLAEQDHEVYRQPWREPGETRRPMLAWAREIPFDGDPSDVHDRAVATSTWLESTDVPKLFVAAEPGSPLTTTTRDWAAGLPSVTVRTVTAGHFVPEDAGPELATILGHWLTTLP